MSGAPVPRKGRAPASDPKGPRPQPPASRAGPGPAAAFGGRAGTVLTEGRRAGGSGRAESPSPGAPSWSRRRPAAVRPGPAARAPPARPLPASRPAGLRSLPAPRARPGARAHARDPGAQRARAPSLPAGPGARSPGPRRCRPALTGCLGRRSPPRRPRRPERCSARPSLSPPHPPRLSPFSRRNRGPALRPSSPAPSPLITPSTHPGPSTAFAAARPDVRCPRRCRPEKGSTAARSQGAGPCVRPAAGRRRPGGDRGGGWRPGRAPGEPSRMRAGSRRGQPRGGRRVPTRASGRGGRGGRDGRSLEPTVTARRPSEEGDRGREVGWGPQPGNAAAAAFARSVLGGEP